MYYVSTRNKQMRLAASQAIAQGLAEDGGLLTPEVFPKLSQNGISKKSFDDWLDHADE